MNKGGYQILDLNGIVFDDYVRYAIDGIFNMKDSVVKGAALLGISKNTVYMHIRNFKNSGKK